MSYSCIYGCPIVAFSYLDADGKRYRQLLCAAFDLAVTRAMLDQHYIRFLYHDGLLEGLDNRKKTNLIEAVRYVVNLELQQIVTVIDSDLPVGEGGEPFGFREDEVVLRLHDEDG